MSTKFNALKERDASLVMNTYGRYPLSVKTASGSRLYDIDGKEYIDYLSGIAVTNLGHSREDLADVMAEQARKMVHVSNLFFQEEQLDLAERLLSTNHFDRVFFCNSGAESNEAAIKLARRYMREVKKRDAYEIITLEGSFHGRTLATVAATGQEIFSKGFEPIPQGFKSVPWGDLDAMAAAITDKTAGILVEIVQGEGGVRPMTQEYADGLQQLCRDRDILFMVDEVQSGMCRTGRFWAHQHYGLEPDIMSSAKALANGLPMGAMMATKDVAAGFAPGSHATTFGGGGVLSAVACKVIDIMLDEKLAERAAELGAYALEQFAKVGDQHPGTIKELRGLGLMIGIEIGEKAPEVWTALLDKGLVCNCAKGTTLRLLPPLTMDKADIDTFASALSEALAAL